MGKSKCVVKKIKVKGYWRFDGLIPKRVKSHIRKIEICKKRKKPKYDY